MPELPDVAAFKQYFDATSLHREIETVEVHSRQVLEGVSAEQLETALEGRTFQSTERYGKWLFVALDDGDWLVLHFGMTGNLRYFKRVGQGLAGYDLVTRWLRKSVTGLCGQVAKQKADYEVVTTWLRPA